MLLKTNSSYNYRDRSLKGIRLLIAFLWNVLKVHSTNYVLYRFFKNQFVATL